jgi:hypothetical protein
MKATLACSSVLALTVMLASCGSKTPDAAGPDNKVTDEAGGTEPADGGRTIVATLSQLTNGDLACYVDYDDGEGEPDNLPGTFDLCEQTALVGQKVVLTVAQEEMADCESAEPCGKTVMTDMVVKIEPAPAE